MSFFNRIKQLYTSEFFKFSAVLLSSNAIAQIIGFFVYPIITRLYNPEIFGLFNFFLSIVSVLTLSSTGRYELAIVLCKSEKKAVALFQLSLLLTVGVSLFFLIIVSLFGKNISALFHHEQMTSLLPYLPVYLLLWGFWQTQNYYFVRQKRYYNLSIYNVTQSVISSGMKCFFGFKGFLTFGLIWGQLLGQFLATSVSAISGRASFKHLKQWDKHEIVSVAKIYANFPKYELPHGLLNSLAGNLPILLLAFYFEMGKIGFFSLALTIGLTPVTLFGSSVYQVLFRKMSERVQNKENIMNDCLLFCKMCVIIILPFFVIFAFMPDGFFTLLFGVKWIGVGFYFKLLLPCLFLSVLVSSLCFIPDIFFKQKTAIQIEIIYLILKVLSLLLGVYFQNFDLAVISYCIVVTLMLIVKLIWYFRIVKNYELLK